MKTAVALLALLGLAACDAGAPAAKRPQAHAAQAPGSGVTFSGYAQVGVSHSF